MNRDDKDAPDPHTQSSPISGRAYTLAETLVAEMRSPSAPIDEDPDDTQDVATEHKWRAADFFARVNERSPGLLEARLRKCGDGVTSDDLYAGARHLLGFLVLLLQSPRFTRDMATVLLKPDGGVTGRNGVEANQVIENLNMALHVQAINSGRPALPPETVVRFTIEVGELIDLGPGLRCQSESRGLRLSRALQTPVP